MIRSAPFVLVATAAAAGCFPEAGTVLVPNSPNAPFAAPLPRPSSFGGAASETATRVQTVGTKLLAANPDLGLKPNFRTIGAAAEIAPPAEIFHQGSTDIFITETLVKQCATDAQLAAVLAQELGKMAAERAAAGGPRSWVPDREPPMEIRDNSDYVGGFGGPADHTNLAERAKFDGGRRQPASAGPQDPTVLARGYLTRAGYPPEALDQAAPLLRKAAVNHTFEKQITNPGPTKIPVKN